jgi:hypothetical protein
VIRLWNRVGLYRTLAVLLLIGAVAGGIAVAADRPTQDPDAASAAEVAAEPAANPEPLLDREALSKQDTERAEAERAARAAAQRKADEAATAAAEQAKKSASPSASAGAKPGTKPPGANVPIPTSCAQYSGNRATGCAVLLQQGFGLDQMGCLDKLWTRESQWRHTARNPSSGAYGIPQALPGPKMATAGSDWQTNPATQIKWGLGYIKDRYSTPCRAWGHSEDVGWY